MPYLMQASSDLTLFFPSCTISSGVAHTGNSGCCISCNCGIYSWRPVHPQHNHSWNEMENEIKEVRNMTTAEHQIVCMWSTVCVSWAVLCATKPLTEVFVFPTQSVYIWLANVAFSLVTPEAHTWISARCVTCSTSAAQGHVMAFASEYL